jgi:hypothetical protein
LESVVTNKQDILALVRKSDLLAIGDALDMELSGTKEALVEVLSKQTKESLADAFDTLNLEDLKALCRRLDLDDCGREKAAICARLFGLPHDQVSIPLISSAQVDRPTASGAPVCDYDDAIRAVAFVGEALWAQYDTQVYRLGGASVLHLPPRVGLSHVQGPWVEFRRGDRYGLGGSLYENQIKNIWLFDSERDQWHLGPWPSEVLCITVAGIEPEDCVIIDHLAGRSFDISEWCDRHFAQAWSPDGRLLAIDDSGRCCPFVPVAGHVVDNAIDSLIGDGKGHLPVLGAGDDPDILGSACQAVARDSGGRLWWVCDLSQLSPDLSMEAGIGSALGREGEVLALIQQSCAAAAFSTDVTRLALMNHDRVSVYATDALAGPPLFEHAFDQALRSATTRAFRASGHYRSHASVCDDIPF